MTDREMLKFAAKAAGYTGFRDASDVWSYRIDQTGAYWNPLTDDGDALRLAVKLRFTIKDFAPTDHPEMVQAPPDAALWGMVEIWRENDNDPLHVEWYKAGADRYAATRLAVVRAAAAIGKEMPQ